jgi:hypothetical protein
LPFSDLRRPPDLAILAVACTAYLLNVLLAKELVGGAFLTNHLNDLLAPLVLLPFASLISKDCTAAHEFIHSVPGIACIILFASFVWEVCAPAIVPKSIGDWRDVLCYVLGGALFRAAHKWWPRGESTARS